MDFPAYLTLIADQFANELRPILALKQVTANTDLLGAYIEVAVRNLTDARPQRAMARTSADRSGCVATNDKSPG
jgi:hypothetical protein